MSLDHEPPTPIRWRAALRAALALRRNPQDTEQVFLLGEAIKGKSPFVLLARFRGDPMGRQRLAERRSLLDTLTRTEWLASLPVGTVGRTYHDFLAEQGLSAQGLVEISKAGMGGMPDDGSDRYYIASRLRDMHDLFHVMSGYGRDELGEVCVLAFSYPHQYTRSFAFIASTGCLVIARRWRHPGAIAAAWQAWRQGRQCAWLPGLSLESLLARPLHDVRRELGIRPPTRYLKVLDDMNRRGAPLPTPPGKLAA